jgi:hypothetical protein
MHTVGHLRWVAVLTCTVAFACSSSSGGGGGAVTGDDGDDGGGSSGGGGGKCSLTLCQNASDCAGTGVATLTKVCDYTAGGGYDGVETVVAVGGGPLLGGVTVPGPPTVGTFTPQSVGTLPADTGIQGLVNCYKTYEEQQAAPGATASGSFTMTLTKVSEAGMLGSGTAYDVHGTLHEVCPGPGGSVTIDAVF